MPRALKAYGKCKKCNEEVIGCCHKKIVLGELYHKSCDNECAICFERITPRFACKLDTCGHIFHKKCIKTWESSGHQGSNTCPCCRKEFKEQIPQPQSQEPVTGVTPILIIILDFLV